MRNTIQHHTSLASAILGSVILANAEPAATIQVNGPGKAISPDLFGIFYEDINYAADGGLYPELIQNRSFEYNATENPAWNQLTGWKLEQRGEGAKAEWMLQVVEPLHKNNPHYTLIKALEPGEGVGLSNEGYDGIAVTAGETYDVSFWCRQLFMNYGWGKDISIEGRPMPMVARLETKDGEVIGEAKFEVAAWEWKKWTGAITPARTVADARFVLLCTAKGGVALDDISLFPRKTFKNRPNGLRADLAQVIADMKPRFVRFPGGCVAHGDGLHNFYRWKDTVGPTEQRRQQKNFWRYHQSVGLGYFEYFQFCEDIGAKPVPIVPAAVSCQHSDQKRGRGQQCVSMADMDAYIQDLLDLIEWSNGPATSKWGAVRAAAGHPEPFHLEYLGVGNEDEISPEFVERFKMIQAAIQKAHPEIKIIGTAGSQPDGENFEHGWKFARDNQVPMVDEHFYRPVEWFLDNLKRYDGYDRKGPKVYIGEYAAHEKPPRNTLRSALAEAAFLTGVERNGDIVRFASYAPLLANRKHIQWQPDLIYFTNTKVEPSLNYHVQKMFGANAGDTWFPVKIDGVEKESDLAVSAVRDSATGDTILKIVNTTGNARSLAIKPGAVTGTRAVKTVLTGDPDAINEIDSQTPPLLPAESEITVGPEFTCDAPANSLTIIRIFAGKS